MEELNSKQNFLSVTGFGLLSGYYLEIMLMVLGQPLEKLMSWNLRETDLTSVAILPLSTGDQVGIRTDTT